MITISTAPPLRRAGVHYHPALTAPFPTTYRSGLIDFIEQVVEVGLGQGADLLARGVVLEAVNEALDLDPAGERPDELIDEAHVPGPLRAPARLPEYLLQVGLADAGAAQDGELPEATAVNAGPAREHGVVLHAALPVLGRSVATDTAAIGVEEEEVGGDGGDEALDTHGRTSTRTTRQTTDATSVPRLPVSSAPAAGSSIPWTPPFALLSRARRLAARHADPTPGAQATGDDRDPHSRL